MIIFVYTVSSVALIVGGMSTGSPYARIGSSREIMAILAYEPILILYALAIYLLTGTFKLSAVDKCINPSPGVYPSYIHSNDICSEYKIEKITL